MRYNGVATVAADMRAGPLQVTNKPLDVSIDGEGFFAVRTPRGERYTRAGAFQIGPEGNLLTSQGYPVLDTSGNPLSVQPDAKNLSIGDDGTLSVDDSEVGQLKTVKFRDLAGLEKDGEQLFRTTARSGAAEAASAVVQSGTLELPNVSIVKGMTDLVSATRAFEALQRAVESFSQLEHKAATDIVGAR
jgi:flagellar basal body rod protein FlgG